jgi:predicted nucleic acid-binding protein
LDYGKIETSQKKNYEKKLGAKLRYLLDTCILIDYLRGDPGVYDLLVKDEDIKLSISTVTMMELMIGAFNKREVTYIQKAFNKIDIIYIDKDISKMAEDFIIQYSKSHNLQIDDSLIAATAIKMNLELITDNTSDFKFIPNIKLYQFETTRQNGT